MDATLYSDRLGQPKIATLRTLTDHERDSLSYPLNLADGHAAQDSSEDYQDLIDALPDLWRESDVTSVVEAEQRFRTAFADLAGSRAMDATPFFMICPSASVSIDIVGAVLATLGRETALVEPTFDNIALLLRRRGVRLLPHDEDDEVVNPATRAPAGALFLVQPNNPTGRTMSRAELYTIAEGCAAARTILVLDNSFRFYNRAPFDDYAVLADTNVSYLALEDTGKVWPTQDLKASLLFCSADLAGITREIYNELFLSCSPFGLRVLERFVRRTKERGLDRVVWRLVDERRAHLRAALAGSRLTHVSATENSVMPVEWLDCSRMGMTDVEFVFEANARGLRLLPGRQFYWASGSERLRHFRVRVAMMKPAIRFAESVAVLADVAKARFADD